MSSSRLTIIFWSSLICAVWFVLTSSFWTYFGNVIISFPFAILSYFLWKKGRQMSESPRFKVIPVLLIIGVAISVVSLIYYLVFE